VRTVGKGLVKLEFSLQIDYVSAKHSEGRRPRAERRLLTHISQAAGLPGGGAILATTRLLRLNRFLQSRGREDRTGEAPHAVARVPIGTLSTSYAELLFISLACGRLDFPAGSTEECGKVKPAPRCIYGIDYLVLDSINTGRICSWIQRMHTAQDSRNQFDTVITKWCS
jgi:hypothetical protein